MKKSLLVAFVFILSVPLLAVADFSLESWQFFKTITVSRDGYVKMTLDDEVARGSKDFTDIRIIGQDGFEVPYQLLVEGDRTDYAWREGSATQAVVDIARRNGQTMFVVDTGIAGELHNELEIITYSKNIKRPVSIYGADALISHDSNGWRLLSSDNYIYNFYNQSAGIDVGSSVVRYPKSTARYTRVVIGNGEGVDPVISGVRVLRYEKTAARESIRTIPISVKENTLEKTTEVLIDFGDSGVPSHALTLPVSTETFSRRAVVQTGNRADDMHRISEGYIFRIATPLFSGSELSLRYPETRARYIRVIVFNNDDRPLVFGSTVSIFSIARSVIFDARSNSAYRLFYGNKDAVAPRYDLSRIFPYLETETMAEATLGFSMDNSDFIAPKEKLAPFSERYPAVLNTVLVLIVVVIAGFLFVYIKKILPKGPGVLPPPTTPMN